MDESELQPPPPPPLPKLNLKKVLEQRAALAAEFQCLAHQEAAADVLATTAAVIVRVLGKSVPDSVALETARAHLSGRTPDESSLRELAWRLAGNAEVLRSGTPLYPFRGFSAPTWVPCQIASAWKDVNRAGEPTANYEMIALAGAYCPGAIKKRFSMRAAALVGRKHLGFSRTRGSRPFRDYRQLVGLRCWVLVDRKNRRDGRPDFKLLQASSAMTQHNREVLKLRLRDGMKCPRGFLHPCHACPVGYRGEDRCPAATHPVAWVVAACPVCDETTWCDPTRPGPCVRCREDTRKLDSRK